MSKFQLLSAPKLRGMLEQRNFWARMKSDKLLAKLEASAPAKISAGGTSEIISYYDEHLQYVFTIHRIKTKQDKIIHEHIKYAYIDGIRYKATV